MAINEIQMLLGADNHKIENKTENKTDEPEKDSLDAVIPHYGIFPATISLANQPCIVSQISLLDRQGHVTDRCIVRYFGR